MLLLLFVADGLGGLKDGHVSTFWLPLAFGSRGPHIEALEQDRCTGALEAQHQTLAPGLQIAQSRSHLHTQRVQLECHYGIRSPKPYHIWF